MSRCGRAREVGREAREARRVRDARARDEKERRQLPLKDVRERQVAVVRPRAQVRLPRRRRQKHVHRRRQRPVRQHHPLWRPLAPRRVHNRQHVVWLRPVLPFFLFLLPFAELHKLLQGHRLDVQRLQRVPVLLAETLQHAQKPCTCLTFLIRNAVIATIAVVAVFSSSTDDNDSGQNEGSGTATCTTATAVTTKIIKKRCEKRCSTEDGAEAGVRDDVADGAGAARGVQRHDREALRVAGVLAQRPRGAVGRKQADRALRRQQPRTVGPAQCRQARADRLHVCQCRAPRHPRVVAVLARLSVLLALSQARLFSHRQ